MESCRMHAKFRTMHMTPHSSMNQDIRWDLAGFTLNFKKLASHRVLKSILLFTKFCVHPTGSHIMSSITLLTISYMRAHKLIYDFNNY